MEEKLKKLTVSEDADKDECQIIITQWGRELVRETEQIVDWVYVFAV